MAYSHVYMNKERYVMNFQELKTNYTLDNGEHFRYLQLRDYFIKEVQTVEILNGVLDVMTRIQWN